MFFKINCTIIKIKNNDIYIEIIDNNDLLKFQNNLLKLYKKNKNFNYNNKIFKLKYNNKTKFNINFSYSDLNSLIGFNVSISGYSKYYSFKFKDEIINPISNTLETIQKNKNGYIFYISKISS